MFFRLICSLPAVEAAENCAFPVDIELPGACRLIFFEESSKTDRGISKNLVLEVTLESSVSDRNKEVFKGLLDRKLDPVKFSNGVLPYQTLSDEIVDARGNIVEPNFLLPLKIFPKHFQDFLRNTSRAAEKVAQNSARFFRWRQRASTQANPVSVQAFDWSLDGMNWRPCPRHTGGHVSAVRRFDFSRDAVKEMRVAYKERSLEPIAHELMWEARDLESRSPRGALMIALAGLEAAVRDYLVHIAPDCRGFIESFPMPPVVTMFCEVLPTSQKSLEKRSCRFIPLTMENGEYLKKWVSQRNQIAHRGTRVSDLVGVAEFVEFAHDLIYVLDYLSGHEWALNDLRSGKFLA